MLTQQEIKQALRASRVVDLSIKNPHGPIGLEQLAQTVMRVQAGGTKVVESFEIPVDTWERLERLAVETTRSSNRPISVSEVASAILQHYVAAER